MDLVVVVGDVPFVLGRSQDAGNGDAGGSELVHPLGHRSALVGQRNRVAVVVDRAERLVHLDEFAAGQPLEHTGLDAVFEDGAVGVLQSQAQPVRHHVGDDRVR